ncbi:heme/hemin ABC transporter substrate-binding protein [Pseudolysinimonas yzui]|uniref:ABC transporter substrate-binding protein n=1 Tax=Pseudolysinimonas yzui TaxID=2708254 RepID=A0A8J3M6D9_9MICO|nr:ABC transporter substrate-binding protein [Pseudolysinimonas yzui]GHF25862.1 ABC transporter substrate-binding protein [Pseudolysinimonas yzui]
MTSRRGPALLGAAFVTALTLALAGCAAPPGGVTTPTPTVADDRPLAELDLVADPREHVGASTAQLASEAIEPVDDDPAQQLPATVTSRDPGGDSEVTVADTSRVIALDLAGSIAASVWGLGFGDTLVGRDRSTTFDGAADLPVVTSNGHTIDAESVLALRPTLIVTDGSVGPRDVLTQLRESGVTVVFVDSEASFDGAVQLARDVAAILGAPAAGELLAERVRADIDAKIAEIAAIAPTADGDKVRMLFLYLRGGSGIYYLFGEESGSADLIRGLAGVDVAGEIGWTGMQPMTDEAIIAANPDLILVMTDGIASAGGIDGLLAAKPAIALTAAGQHRRFVDMADGDILSFGPRSAAILDALARAIYAPSVVE